MVMVFKVLFIIENIILILYIYIKNIVGSVCKV